MKVTACACVRLFFFSEAILPRFLHKPCFFLLRVGPLRLQKEAGRRPTRAFCPLAKKRSSTTYVHTSRIVATVRAKQPRQSCSLFVAPPPPMYSPPPPRSPHSRCPSALLSTFSESLWSDPAHSSRSEQQRVGMCENGGPRKGGDHRHHTGAYPHTALAFPLVQHVCTIAARGVHVVQRHGRVACQPCTVGLTHDEHPSHHARALRWGIAGDGRAPRRHSMCR